MNTDETRDLIERYYAALTTGDRDTVASVVADECVWIPPRSAPFGRVEGGPAVVAELTGDTVKRTFDLKQPFAVEVRPKMIVDGDTAVVQQRIIATAKETGSAYDNEYCWIYTCAHGKITCMEEYADTVVAAKAMGWDL